MKTQKLTAVLLVTAFSTGLAGFTISQTTAREAKPQRADYYADYHRAVPEFGNFADIDIAEFAEMARWQEIGDRPNSRGRLFSDPENLTPEQRREAFRKFLEDRLRESLTRHGFVQEELQDAVVEFSRIVENDRRTIQEKSGKLREGMSMKANDAQIAALLADLRRSVALAKQRRDRGRNVLNARIGLYKKPRLDAVLSLSGLGGDESAYLMSGFGGRPFGRRGFGGHGGR